MAQVAIADLLMGFENESCLKEIPVESTCNRTIY
jgi:hypothetical protein